METGRWYVGVDLGQSRDFTVMAVLERVPPARADAAGDAVSGDGGAGD